MNFTLKSISQYLSSKFCSARGVSKIPGIPQISTIFCWVKLDFPYKSKSCGAIFKKLTYLKNSNKNTSNKKKITPYPIKGAVGRGDQYWKNPAFYELNSYKTKKQIFKILTFLKTRDKTPSNKKKSPPTSPMGGTRGGGSKMSPVTANY